LPLPPFVCKRIEKEDFWALTDQTREKYWPENTLPVDTEAIVEFRLRLKIEPCHSLLSMMGMVAFLKRDLQGVVVE
jgi:hypothetical protein